MSDIFEGDWCIDGGKTWFMFDEVKYCVVNGPLIVQDFLVEVHAEDGNVFFVVGGLFAIFKFHCHDDVTFMVSWFFICEEADVFPC